VLHGHVQGQQGRGRAVQGDPYAGPLTQPPAAIRHRRRISPTARVPKESLNNKFTTRPPVIWRIAAFNLPTRAIACLIHDVGCRATEHFRSGFLRSDEMSSYPSCAASSSLSLVLSAPAHLPRPDHGHLRASRHRTLAEWPAGSGDPGSSEPPVVHRMVWYKSAPPTRRPANPGLAHFLEHLMFKAHQQASGREFSQTVLKVGGNENAFTSVRLHRLLPARGRASQLGNMMEIRGATDYRPHPQTKTMLPERDVLPGIQHAGRQHSEGAAKRADHGRALSQPPMAVP